MKEIRIIGKHPNLKMCFACGLAATILDETIGRAIMLSEGGNIWGVTIDFSMRLRKPVPLDEEVWVLARITK